MCASLACEFHVLTLMPKFNHFIFWWLSGLTEIRKENCRIRWRDVSLPNLPQEHGKISSVFSVKIEWNCLREKSEVICCCCISTSIILFEICFLISTICVVFVVFSGKQNVLTSISLQMPCFILHLSTFYLIFLYEMVHTCCSNTSDNLITAFFLWEIASVIFFSPSCGQWSFIIIFCQNDKKFLKKNNKFEQLQKLVLLFSYLHSVFKCNLSNSCNNAILKEQI